jgi:simple sugar transport system permease protein
MTATVTESAPPPETDRKAVERRPPIGDSWLVTLLAFIVALVIGGILMALSDQTVRNDMGYFFQSPADTFRDSWYTIRDAYQAMFEGAIFAPNHAYTASLFFFTLSN